MTKLREALLVDDEEADNFYHRRVLEKLGCCERISQVEHGQMALDYLTTPVDGELPRPDLILLDINMPVLTGWEFLDRYAELPAEARAGVVLVMVTTSSFDRDRERASEMDIVTDFHVKPLKRPHVLAILEEHFPEVHAAVTG